MYDTDEIIIKKGDLGDELYVIMVGEVGVYIDDSFRQCVVELSENQTYGERSL